MLNGKESGEHQQPRALSSWRETAEMEKDSSDEFQKPVETQGGGSPWCHEAVLEGKLTC